MSGPTEPINSHAADASRRAFLKATGATLLASSLGAGSANPDAPLAPPDKQPPDLSIPGPAPKTLGWAVVGLGELALGQILPAFAEAEQSKLVALVSGHREKAEKVAAHYRLDPKNVYDYESFDRIAENPAIDVVYIVLPNSLHAEYTVRALKAGKHVLCEKPMAVTPAECQQMIDAAKAADRKLMIAYRLRHEPYNVAMIEMARKKPLGPVKLIAANNDQQTTPPNIRLSKSTGGGPVGDVGIYCINAARYITGEEPTEVQAAAFAPPDQPRFREVPASVAFTLRFPSGVLATNTCSFDAGRASDYRVVFEKGWALLDPAFDYVGQQMHVFDGKNREQIVLKHVNQFAKEMDHLSQCVIENKPPITPGEEGLADIRIIAAVMRAAESGAVVKLDSLPADARVTG